MDANTKLLILEEVAPTRDPRSGSGIARTRALNAISSSGAKVLHDSGGRFLVIEASEAAAAILRQRLPGARLVSVDEDLEQVQRSVADLDATESLFLDALKIRSSPTYRDAKRRRTPGESPEERELRSAPDGCVRGY